MTGLRHSSAIIVLMRVVPGGRALTGPTAKESVCSRGARLRRAALRELDRSIWKSTFAKASADSLGAAEWVPERYTLVPVTPD